MHKEIQRIFGVSLIIKHLKSCHNFNIVLKTNSATNFNLKVNRLYLNLSDIKTYQQYLMNDKKPPFQIKMTTDLANHYWFDKINQIFWIHENQIINEKNNNQKSIFKDLVDETMKQVFKDN